MPMGKVSDNKAGKGFSLLNSLLKGYKNMQNL